MEERLRNLITDRINEISMLEDSHEEFYRMKKLLETIVSIVSEDIDVILEEHGYPNMEYYLGYKLFEE
jgi:hypothetical protein